RDTYLEPYHAAMAALDDELRRLSALVADNPSQVASVAALRDVLDAKLRQLNETVEVHRTRGPEAAVALILTGRSKAAMDAIRLQVHGMQLREGRLLQARAVE